MTDYIYEFACHEYDELQEKAKNGGLSMQEMQYADLLAHYKKDALAVEGMEGYSNDDGMSRTSYRRGRSMTTGRYMSRESRYPEYSGRYYSREGEKEQYIAKLEGMLDGAPDDATRSKLMKIISDVSNKMES